MTREELYELVWSQPMRTVARSKGISDVALAKQCRRSNVPVPPRGWWARKEAGKPVEVQPLPPLPFAMANYFPARELSTEAEPQRVEEPTGEDDLAAPPAFRDIEEVRREIQAAVRVIKVPATLTSPHPIVARLLKQDEDRKAKQPDRGYISSYYGPKFTSALQQRRLRILSSLLVELERLGCKAQGSTHAGERFSINVGGRWTYILLGTEGVASMTSFYHGGRSAGRPDREQLRLDLVDHSDRDPPARTWRENEKPLESQVTEIICGIFVRVEEDARKWALWLHKDRLEQRARAAREAKLAAEKAEAERIARSEAAAAARIRALLDGADSLERAAKIRRYVGAVQAVRTGNGAQLSGDALDAWATWALAEADQIDPIVSGEFISQLRPTSRVD